MLIVENKRKILDRKIKRYKDETTILTSTALGFSF